MTQEVSTRQVEAVRAIDLVDALDSALRNPSTWSTTTPRTSFPVTAGELLLMPAASPAYAGVKVVSVAPDNPARNLPRIQGSYLLFEADTLVPCALIDAGALTAVRTAAVSMLGIRALDGHHAADTVVVGTGVQARSHLRLLTQLGWGGRLTVLGRRPEAVRTLVAEAGAGDVHLGEPGALARAELAIFCTSATSPVVSSTDLATDVVVVAIGSHSAAHAEVGPDVFEGATVVVEDVPTALREAGDVIQALAAGTLRERDLFDLVHAPTPRGGRRVFKSVGMAWEDLAVASVVYEQTRGETSGPRW